MWIEINTSTSVSCLPAAFTMLVVKACDPSSRSYTRIAILAGRRPLSCIVFSNLVMTVCAGTRSFSCHLHDGWTLYHIIMRSSCTARFGSSSTSLRPSSQGIVFENLGPRHNLIGAGFSLPLFNFSRKKPPQLRALITGITRKGNTTRILPCMQKIWYAFSLSPTGRGGEQFLHAKNLIGFTLHFLSPQAWFLSPSI